MSLRRGLRLFRAGLARGTVTQWRSTRRDCGWAVVGVKFSSPIECVESHTAGEPTRIVVGGLPEVPGASMADKRAWLAVHADALRTALMHEPRGHADMFGAILLSPTQSQAQLGVVFMDGGGWLPMCGHGAIGVATVAVETGRVACSPPETVLMLEAPAGLVRCRVRVENGKARQVALENVPSFLVQSDVVLDVAGLGRITCDVAFGGSFFALVDGQKHGLAPAPPNRLVQVGLALRDALSAALCVQHPTQPYPAGVDLIEFYWKSTAPGVDYAHCVVFGDGQIDRSPCGTGTSAHLAALWARGELDLDAPTVHAGPLGTTFTARALRATAVGPFPAVIPEIIGTAWITGYSQFVIDAGDALGGGFRL